MAKNKKLWIDMCAGSELKDTQGETLSVEGANIEELEQGRGRFNDNHGKGFFNSLGRVTEAKKIFKAEDCEDDRQRYYWEKIKAPYVYCKGYLYNDDDHPNARAAAAILRNIHREDTPLKLKASVEGGVLSRGIKDPTRLARTKIHSVALTFTPANNATLVEPLNIDKSSTDWEADKQLIKSVMHLAETNVPSFRHIQRHASAHTIFENINKIQELAKSIGVEIEVRELDPQVIMEKAVLDKVATNISKINSLVKGAKDLYNVMKPSATQSSAAPAAVSPAPKEKLMPQKAQAMDAQRKDAQRTARDKFQQDIGKLKADSSVPTTPKATNLTDSGGTKVQSAAKVKHTNTLKGHASKAMRDPKHLDTVHNSLMERGVDPKKAKLIISKIKSHMQEPVKKSCDDDVEKGDVGRALKGAVLATAMAVGADSMSPKTKPNKPEVKREVASAKSKKKKQDPLKTDPDKLIGAKAMGYDERQPNAKAKFREKIKNKLKKALTAGYGGAGAPTDLTGGGVFQAESLDDRMKSTTIDKDTKKAESKDGLQYISCDDCGHEQVYMKHQVKCRKCRKNFSLNKLENMV